MADVLARMLQPQARALGPIEPCVAALRPRFECRLRGRLSFVTLFAFFSGGGHSSSLDPNGVIVWHLVATSMVATCTAHVTRRGIITDARTVSNRPSGHHFSFSLR